MNQSNLESLKATISALNERLADIEAENTREQKPTLSTYKTGLNLLESATNIMEGCKDSTTGICSFVKQYVDALTDPNGPREERIYETFISGLSNYTYLQPVETELAALGKRIETHQQNIDLTEILDTMLDTTSSYIVPNIEESVINYMEEKTSANKTMLLQNLENYAFDPFVKQILQIVNLDVSKYDLVREAYNEANGIASMEEISTLGTSGVSKDVVVTAIEAITSTLAGVYLPKASKWFTLQNKKFTILDDYTVLSNEVRDLANILRDNQENIHLNEISGYLEYFTENGDFVTIMNDGGIEWKGETFTLDEFIEYSQNMTMDKLSIYSINNIVVLSKGIDSLTILDNVYLYSRDNVWAYVAEYGKNEFGKKYSIVTRLEENNVVYNNLTETNAVEILNEVLGTHVVSMYESTKDEVEADKNKFKRQCAKFESQIKELEEKKSKISKLVSEFEGSRDLEDAMGEIDDEIDNVKDAYSKYQKSYEPIAKSQYTEKDNSDIKIKGISAQKATDVNDVTKPLYMENENPNGEEVDSLDVRPQDDELEYPTTINGLGDDEEDEYVENPYNGDYTLGSENDYSEDFEKAYQSAEENMYTEDEEESVASLQDLIVNFNKNLKEEKVSKEGQVTFSKEVVDPNTYDVIKKIYTYNFVIIGTTDDALRNINLYSANEDTPYEIDKADYNAIINKISESPEYSMAISFENKVNQTDDYDALLDDEGFEKIVSNITLTDQPIKKLVVEGYNPILNKKFTRKFKIESNSHSELNEQTLEQRIIAQNSRKKGFDSSALDNYSRRVQNELSRVRPDIIFDEAILLTPDYRERGYTIKFMPICERYTNDIKAGLFSIDGRSPLSNRIFLITDEELSGYTDYKEYDFDNSNLWNFLDGLVSGDGHYTDIEMLMNREGQSLNVFDTTQMTIDEVVETLDIVVNDDIEEPQYVAESVYLKKFKKQGTDKSEDELLTDDNESISTTLLPEDLSTTEKLSKEVEIKSDDDEEKSDEEK